MWLFLALILFVERGSFDGPEEPSRPRESTGNPEADRSKVRVQMPVKKALQEDFRGEGKRGAREAEQSKIAPGKVAWHASFDDACAAARESGKPVLLFQLLGRLDEEFC